MNTIILDRMGKQQISIHYCFVMYKSEVEKLRETHFFKINGSWSIFTPLQRDISDINDEFTTYVINYMLLEL